MDFPTPPFNLAVPLFLICIVGLYIYRAFFDSLSHIPGPKLAAATLWYEFYYDVIKKGKYTWEIGKMHQKYGPIVRINPYEVHIHDPQYIDHIYPGSHVRTEKYAWAMRMFGLKYAFVSTLDHDLHRMRRNAFSRYFSKASLQRLEPGIQSVLDLMLSRLENIRGTGKVINLLGLYTCLTGDIISQYAFAHPHGLLDDPDFSPHWYRIMMSITRNTHLLKQFGFLMPLVMATPEWLSKSTIPGMKMLIDLRKGFRNQAIRVKSDVAEGRKPEGQDNIFYDVLTNDKVHLQEKNDDDFLQDNAQAIVAAGTNTTAHILAITHYYILTNPDIHFKLQAELGKLMAGNPHPKWSDLEQLPYLSAIITEGLRIGYGVTHRLQRLFPDTTLQYDKYAIPASTPVSMTSVLIHDDPSLFPDPRTFKPERFLENPWLKKYLVVFSRGTRQCAGLNLAYAELYLGLAAVFAPGRFRWELWETGLEDVETEHDFFGAYPRLGSKGIRVVVK